MCGNEKRRYRWVHEGVYVSGNSPAELEQRAIAKVSELTSTEHQALAVTGRYLVGTMPGPEVIEGMVPAGVLALRDSAPDDRIYALVGVGEPADLPEAWRST
jgi:hypothetical protein